MSATESLRQLLDKHGMEHYDGTEVTLWLNDGTCYRASAHELSNGMLQLHMWWATPEEAVSATLGHPVSCSDCAEGLGAYCDSLCDPLKIENAKLRELVQDMWFWCYCGHMDSETKEWQMSHIDGVLDRMRELGAEVK